jgi:hypothetical protein
MHTENWIIDNHVPLPGSGGPQLTLMEEKALREEAERAVSHASTRYDLADRLRLKRRKVARSTNRV